MCNKNKYLPFTYHLQLIHLLHYNLHSHLHLRFLKAEIDAGDLGILDTSRHGLYIKKKIINTRRY